VDDVQKHKNICNICLSFGVVTAQFPFTLWRDKFVFLSTAEQRVDPRHQLAAVRVHGEAARRDIRATWSVYEGGWQVFGFIKRTTSYGIEKKYMFTYSPLSSTHLWRRCSNFFNPSIQEKVFWLCCKPPVGEIEKAKDLSEPPRRRVVAYVPLSDTAWFCVQFWSVRGYIHNV
jgi:hypothetical protein